ncbi:hypothetical protein [Nitratifractor sp.]
MELLTDPQYYVFHIAIFLIAVSLIATLIHEMRKPRHDPNDNPDTKRMNDLLNDELPKEK